MAVSLVRLGHLPISSCCHRGLSVTNYGWSFFPSVARCYINFFGSEGVKEVMKGITEGLIKKTNDGVMKLINWLTGTKLCKEGLI